MPARIHKIRHDENTRLKIRVVQLLKFLDDHVAGVREMQPSQVRAAEILLSKALPSLTSVEHSGEITTTKVLRLPEIIDNDNKWLEQHTEMLEDHTEPDPFKTGYECLMAKSQ